MATPVVDHHPLALSINSTLPDSKGNRMEWAGVWALEPRSVGLNSGLTMLSVYPP